MVSSPCWAAAGGCRRARTPARPVTPPAATRRKPRRLSPCCTSLRRLDASMLSSFTHLHPLSCFSLVQHEKPSPLTAPSPAPPHTDDSSPDGHPLPVAAMVPAPDR